MKAWDVVQSSTLRKCWDHTGILPTTTAMLPYQPPTPAKDPESEACNIITFFATTTMEIPEVINLLEKAIGHLSSTSKSVKALDSIFEYRQDLAKFEEYIKMLTLSSNSSQVLLLPPTLQPSQFPLFEQLAPLAPLT